MSLSGLLDFLEALWHRGQVLGFLVGLATAALVGAWLRRRFVSTRLGRLEDEKATLASESTHLTDEKGPLSGRCRELQESNALLNDRCRAAEGRSERLARERDESRAESADLRDRLGPTESALADEIEARKTLERKYLFWMNTGIKKRWDRPVVGPFPAFRDLSERQTPIISVVNLKGGVGKTTITANLGATFALRGLRVLLIDLDYQSSLSQLCLSAHELEEVEQGRRYIQEVFRTGEIDRPKVLAQCATRTRERELGETSIVATHEDLAAVETDVLAHWMFHKAKDDVRFRLRSALHSPEISSRYDLILIDCPPRLEAACVNALAASDYALVPVLIEPRSLEAVPRLLHWLKKYRASFCPDLKVLGVVANKTGVRTTLTARQGREWNSFKDKCLSAWGEAVNTFDESSLRQFSLDEGELAVLSPKYRPELEALADEILKELPIDARPRIAAVSPVAPPAAQSVRG